MPRGEGDSVVPQDATTARKVDEPEIPFVSSPEEIAAMTEHAIGQIYGRALSGEALQGFLLALSQNSQADGVILVDRPESSIRPSLDIHVHLPRPIDYRSREDNDLHDELNGQFADFLITSERAGFRYNSHLTIYGNQHHQTPSALRSHLERQQEGTPARVVAAARFVR